MTALSESRQAGAPSLDEVLGFTGDWEFYIPIVEDILSDIALESYPSSGRLEFLARRMALHMALIDIEITPEMIEAGVDALFQSDAIYEYSGIEGSLARATSDIFRAMLALAPLKVRQVAGT